MTTRNNRKVTYLTDEEAAQLSEWADEVGKSESHLLREAVLEYLDHDRTSRIEEQLDTIEEKIEMIAPPSENSATHTHKDRAPTTKASSTVEKARQIAQRLHENHDPPVKVLDVERAIEDIAGADNRTLNKYKGLLKKRGLLFAHPTSGVWTDDREQWVGWVEKALFADGEIQEFLSDYQMTSEEYGTLVEEVAGDA